MKSLLLSALVACVALVSCVPAAAADLSITAANVVPSANAVIRQATAGATITAGQLIYQDVADLDLKGQGKAKLSDANGASALRVIDGIAINSASAGQLVAFVTYDPDLQLASSGLTANTILISSANAGAIAPAADLTTGWYLTVVAVVKSGTKVFFRAPGLISSAVSS